MDKITVLCPNGHRVTISTSRHASLSEVLDDACKKKSFDPKSHVLQHHDKNLDMTLTIHLANLPRNAQLEMVPLEATAPGSSRSSTVSICVQLESGERIMNDFGSENSLQDIFDHVKAGGKIPEGDTSDSQPVFVYMRREFMGADDFQKTTLQRLGLTQGRAIIRLVFRRLDSMGHQASVYNMKEREPPKEKAEVPWRPMKTEEETKPAFQASPDVPETLIPTIARGYVGVTLDDVKNDEASVGVAASSSVVADDDRMDTTEAARPGLAEQSRARARPEVKEDAPEMEEDEPEVEQEELLTYIDETVVVFKREAGKSTKVRIDQDLDDDFFELTIEDARRLQADLIKKVKQFASDEPLMTVEMRNAVREGEKLGLLKRHPKSVVRIQFPDQLVLQGIFLSGQTVGDVEEFVRRYLFDSAVTFHLLIPPSTRLEPAMSLLDAGCVPSSLLRFIPASFERGKDPETDSFLKKTVVGSLSNTKGADKAIREAGVVRMTSHAAESSEGSTVKKAKLDDPEPSTSRRQADQTSSSSSPSTSKPSSDAPKWFKMQRK